MKKFKNRFHFSKNITLLVFIVIIIVVSIIAILYSTDFLKNYSMTKMWLDFLKDIVSWPFVILIISIIFRNSFDKLIARIANVKIGDKEVNFLEDIVKVESRLQKVELSQDGNLGIETDTRDKKMERLIGLNPSAAILISWIEFESKLQDVYNSLFQIEGTDKALNLQHTPFRPVGKILRELYYGGKIDKDIYESAMEMSGLRNKIVHAQSDNITEEVAESYVMTINKLKKYFDNL
ncbi:hypothetical protein [Streptococcus constellatus]|uniref:hypothetical protein n=1 Tax=Streptococcus constellatus TaxID=76860 RepID=UPI00189C173A|nr:hypothetical protein [Streptococcus constellatus]